MRRSERPSPVAEGSDFRQLAESSARITGSGMSPYVSFSRAILWRSSRPHVQETPRFGERRSGRVMPTERFVGDERGAKPRIDEARGRQPCAAHHRSALHARPLSFEAREASPCLSGSRVPSIFRRSSRYSTLSSARRLSSVCRNARAAFARNSSILSTDSPGGAMKHSSGPRSSAWSTVIMPQARLSSPNRGEMTPPCCVPRFRSARR